MTEPLTIACSGTHGSGKSTLTNALAKELRLDPINISRPTTAAQQLGYAKAADVPAEQVQLFQWMGLFEQIHQERIRLERPGTYSIPATNHGTGEPMNYTGLYQPGFVSDRSVVDFLAYYRYRVPEYERLSEYRQLVEAYANKYSTILYLPPNPNGVVDDNRRFVEGTEEIDENVRQIFIEFRLSNVIVVHWDTVENRVEYVREQLLKRGMLNR